MLESQIRDLERQIGCVIAREEASANKARLLRSIPGNGPVSAAVLIAEMPESGRMGGSYAPVCIGEATA